MSTVFQAITVVGGVVPPSMLGRIQSGEVNDAKSLAPDGYRLIGTETIRDAASRTWMYLQDAWSAWRESDAAKRPEGTGAGTGDARQKWLLVMLRELGYGHVQATPGGLTIGEESYPISHRWESVPIHLLGPGLNLDKRTPKEAGAARRAPQAMVQEFLNREDDYLWAILSNGLKLRLLRDSTALAGSGYIEFDLETIFDSDLYSEFQLLWQLCHESRLAKRGGSDAPADDCWMETWRSESVQAGARALDKLGDGVEKALNSLGSGFLRHPDNRWLVEALHSGELRHRDYHKALLRTAYRLLFLFVVEDRGALLAPEANKRSRQRYDDYFSTQRLRKMARTRDGGPHPDLWRTQKMVLSALGGEGLPAIGLPALGGLFDPDPRAKTIDGQPHDDLLLGAELANQDFLNAIRSLGWVSGKSGRMQPVDYRHLGAEELGSVYESLLEFVARVDTETRSFELALLSGNDRKTTGSYYTPPNLVSALLDTALDPLLDAAVNGGANAVDREARLLALTVCDPASGSGGFLVAAARRIARRVAEVRAGDNEPTPSEVQTALHDVVERCIYGVDMNDLAAELAKVSLWLEAMQPGKPLGFLDARIKIGNSLLGATPALLADGVPDGAFTVLEGDEKKYAAEAKKRNKAENTRKVDRLFGSLGQETFSFGGTTSALSTLISQRQALVEPVSSAQEARARAKAYTSFDHSDAMEQKRLHADAWCAAFVWPLKENEPAPPTSSIVRQLGESGTAAGYLDTVTLVRKLAQHYRFFHWHLEFPEVFGNPDTSEALGPEGWPGGFSCMLGNPPWDQIQFDPQEYFAADRPEIYREKRKDIRDELIASLEVTDPVMFSRYKLDKARSAAEKHFLHDSGRFPLSSYGRLNTYSLFTELFQSLCSPQGISGVIVPTNVATDKFNQYLIASLVDRQRIVGFFDFENSVPFFPQVHRSYKFCLLTTSGRSRKNTQGSFAFFLSDPAEIATSSFELTAHDLRLINPNTVTLPIFRNKIDAELTRDVYRNFPILLDDTVESENHPWKVGFMLMFMSNTSASLLVDDADVPGEMKSVSGSKLSEIDDDKMLRYFESKMIHQYDSKWASIKDGKAIEIPNLEKLSPTKVAQPRYWISAANVRERTINWTHNWHMGWRDIARSTDSRTMIATIVDGASATDGGFPLLLPHGGARDASVLLSILNSFVFDFFCRQKVGGMHVRQFTMKQLPFPSPKQVDDNLKVISNYDSSWMVDRVLELVYVGSELAGFAVELGDHQLPFVFNLDRRAVIRAELDAAMFHIFGMSNSEASYVMDTFPLVRNAEIKEFGNYKTRQIVMEIYDRMKTAIDTGVPFISTLNPPPGQGPRHPAKETTS